MAWFTQRNEQICKKITKKQENLLKDLCKQGSQVTNKKITLLDKTKTA